MQSNVKKTIEEKEKQMLAEADKKQAEWLRRNGFNSEGYTYIVCGETYSIKEQLKDAGFRYDPILMWHQSEVPADYKDKVQQFHWQDLLEFSAWGEGHFFAETKQQIKNLVQPAQEISSSEWIEGDKIQDLLATFVKKHTYQSRYGLSNIYTFQTEEDNILVWFTTTNPDIKLGDSFFLSGRIKDRKEYNGVKQTIITRVTFK